MGECITRVAKYFWQVLINLREAVERWLDDDAGLLAAGVAFYATVSMVPLLLVLIAGLSLFLRHTSWGLDAELNLLVAIEDNISSEVADAVSIALGQVQEQTTVGGPLGLIGLVAAAMAVFSRFDRALEMIWKTERRRRANLWGTALDVARLRLKAFATLMVLGLVVLAIFSADMALSTLSKFTAGRSPGWEWFWHVTQMGVSIALNAGVFGLIYRLLGRSTIDWRRALRGGLLAAATWEAGRLLLAEFLIGDRYTTYGIVGSLLVVMLWAYYATSVLLLGAEYVQVIRERESPRTHGAVDVAKRHVAQIPDEPLSEDALDTLRFDQLDHGFRRWRPRRRPARAA